MRASTRSALIISMLLAVALSPSAALAASCEAPEEPAFSRAAANDGVVGGELWKSDGTEGGTVLVADIAKGPASAAGLALFPGRVVGDSLVVRADDGVHGSEYWTTDGTAVGTMLLADLWPGPTGSTG